MVELKTQYPFIDNGIDREDLIKHYAEDEEGVRFFIKQNETGYLYEEAVDVYPCRYSYTATDMPVVVEEDEEDEEENVQISEETDNLE